MQCAAWDLAYHPVSISIAEQRINYFQFAQRRQEIFEARSILIFFPLPSFWKCTNEYLNICQVISILCKCSAEGQNQPLWQLPKHSKKPQSHDLVTDTKLLCYYFLTQDETEMEQNCFASSPAGCQRCLQIPVEGRRFSLHITWIDGICLCPSDLDTVKCTNWAFPDWFTTRSPFWWNVSKTSI